MNRILALTAAVALAAVAHAEDKPKLDPAKILGTWTITSGIHDGEKVPAEKLKGDVTVEKEKMTVKAMDMTFAFKYSVKPNGDVDLEILEPEAFKGSKAQGIVEATEAGWKLAYNPKGDARPKNFEAKKDTGEFSYVLEKKK